MENTNVIVPGVGACLSTAPDPIGQDDVEFLVLEVKNSMAHCTWDEDDEDLGHVHCEQWIALQLLRTI